MNKELLHINIQEFINSNIKENPSDLMLKGFPFDHIEPKAIIEQIEAKSRCEKKLPTWYTTPNIYYPNKLNIEQTSSEATAKYKANLVSGRRLIDLTGGFGVDSYFFSKRINEVTHCEINTNLSSIAAYNSKVLNSKGITHLNTDGITTLKDLDTEFNWIYIDPSRRNHLKNKVFLLSDCIPNIKTFQGLFLKYANNVMVKTSPLLDISATLLDLQHVKHIHVVAVKNEVKELLWVLERNYTGKAEVKTCNIISETPQLFNFIFNEELKAQVSYTLPLDYLYEPNAAILKSGGFNSISEHMNVSKLHKHSHLYSSEALIPFPGRRFKILDVLPFNKKQFSKTNIEKGNITTRNFPLSVNTIKKKLNIKDGGQNYLFFTTNLMNEKIILICSKVL